jgi:hypothetical protein
VQSVLIITKAVTLNPAEGHGNVKKNDKTTNNDPQNITQKTKNREK